MSDSIPSHSAPEFSSAVRGYDRLQVETYLDRLRDQLDECVARLRRTEDRAAAAARERNARITELEDQLAALERRRLDQTAPTFSALGTRIGQMLDLAAAEGTALKERAAREAEEILDRARREADEAERTRTEGQERLQRQLVQLRDTLLGVLGPDAAPAGPQSSDAEVEEQQRRVVDLTQAIDAQALLAESEAESDTGSDTQPDIAAPAIR